MKHLFQYLLLAGVAGVALTGCKSEEDDLFDKSAAERLNEVSDIYTQRLADSKGGWVMEYYATNDVAEYDCGEAASFMCFPFITQFKADGTVLVAMDNAVSGSKEVSEDMIVYNKSGYSEESSLWEVITDNGPVLTFNTYNSLFHSFSDPRSYSISDLGNGAYSSGWQGLGIGGDYEFVMIDVPEGGQFVTLKGKKRGTYIRLTRLPEGTDFKAYLAELQEFQYKVFPETAPNYCVLTVDGKRFKTNDIFSTIVNLYPYDGDEIADESYHPFAITKRDGKFYLRFRDKLSYTYNATEEKIDFDLQELVYDESKDIFVDENNAENTLQPEEPDLAFANGLKIRGMQWSWTDKTEMSESFAAIISDLAASFSKSKYTINKFSIRNNKDKLSFRIEYKSGRSSTSVEYPLTYVFEDGKVKFAYNAEETSAAATKLLNNNPAIQSIIDVITSSLTVELKSSKWNQSKLNLVSASDTNKWFQVSR